MDYDIEFDVIQENFIKESTEQAVEKGLDLKTIALLRLANNVAINAFNEVKVRVQEALNNGATVTEIKETVYQAAPYIGFARVNEALTVINKTLNDQHISPVGDLEATVDMKTRFEKGLKVQCQIFGEDHILDMRESAPEDMMNIQDDLSANCFGDYYTRGCLDLKMREMITFTVIISIGGADSQANSHAIANKSVGNTKNEMLGLTTALLPFNGYPRTLNADAAINNVYK